MKNAILLHGTCDKDEYFDDNYPSLSNSHWFPWLQKQLLIKGIHTETPEMPDAYMPEYSKWKKNFEKYYINEETLLVGHSCGGGFLVRWLSENDIKVDRVVLVAPWLDPERVQTTDFFEFEISKNLKDKANKMKIFASDNDDTDIDDSIEIIKKNTEEISLQIFKGQGHFTFGNMGTEKFPELLSELID